MLKTQKRMNNNKRKVSVREMSTRVNVNNGYSFTQRIWPLNLIQQSCWLVSSIHSKKDRCRRQWAHTQMQSQPSITSSLWAWYMCPIPACILTKNTLCNEKITSVKFVNRFIIQHSALNSSHISLQASFSSSLISPLLVCSECVSNLLFSWTL